MSHLTQEKVIELGLERNIIMIHWLSAGLSPFLEDRFLNKGLRWWLRGKELVCQCRRHRFNPWVGKIPWRRKRQLTPLFLPRKCHGQRSLAGYSPWGHERVRLNSATKYQQSSITLTLSDSFNKQLLKACRVMDNWLIQSSQLPSQEGIINPFHRWWNWG